MENMFSDFTEKVLWISGALWKNSMQDSGKIFSGNDREILIIFIIYCVTSKIGGGGWRSG
jgi:hypothetical protein